MSDDKMNEKGKTVSPKEGSKGPRKGKSVRKGKTGRRGPAAARHESRCLLVQALYQWHMNKDSISKIEAQFLVDNDMKKVDGSYFSELLHEIPKKLTELDTAYVPFLDRQEDQVDPIERAILRIGAYELLHRLDIPYRVVINEAIDLAKNFGGEDGHKYVNGVLDKLAGRARMEEKLQKRTKK
jgi:N utilization substance protein B